MHLVKAMAWGMTAALITGLTAPAVAAEAAEEELEQVVVTGSYIKRDNFDTSTPVSVVDAAEIDNQATPVLGEVVRNLPFNYGTDTITQILSNTPTEGNSAATNLRGLGASATLQLMDGRRTAIPNINQLYPQIAIARFEVLKDGAAALYGTDAVAGVINFIPRKEFDGIEVRAFNQAMVDDDWNESNFSIIGGGGTSETRVVVALEYLDRDRLMQREVPEYTSSTSAVDNAALTISGDGSPGTWRVPSRDATGQLTGASGRAVDPVCGRDPATGQITNTITSFEDQTNFQNNVTGIFAGSTCFYNFGEFFDFVSDQERVNGYTFFSHQFSDNLTFEGELVFSRQENISRGSPSNSSGRFADTNAAIGAILGIHPGNPFTAMADRGSGLERLYAVDLNANGLPDRDIDGDGIPDPGHEDDYRATVVTNPDDPFSPTGTSCGPNGCIGFNEDVRVQNFRPFTKQPRGRPTVIDETGASPGNEQDTRYSFRWSGGVLFDVPDTTWSGSLFFTHHEAELEQYRSNVAFPSVVNGLTLEADEETGEVSCLLLDGPGGQIGDCFNPFWTSQYDCTRDSCDMALTPESSEAFNDPFIWDQMLVTELTTTTQTLDIIDAIVTGSPFSWAAGDIGVALGIQYRILEYEVDDSDLANTCSGWRNPCGFDFILERDNFAAFFETVVPLMDGAMGYAEVQLAGRYTDVEDVGTDFTPKIAGLWQPTNWLSLRASVSESFVAPGIVEIAGPQISFQQSIGAGDDYLNPNFEAFITRTVRANPDLVPETSDNYNLGFTLSLLQGDLSVGMDYFNFDFVDRLVATNARQVLALAQTDFEEFRASQPDPDDFAAVRAAWLASGLEDPAIERSLDGVLQNVFVSTQNAQTSEVSGLDFNIRYNVPWTDWGNWVLTLNGAWMEDYKFALPGEPVRQVEGVRNDFTASLPPLPELVMNLGINWTLGNNSIATYVRFQDDVEQDGSRCLAGGQIDPNRCDPELEGLTTVDLTYTRSFDGLLGGDRHTTLSIGGKNIFDAMPDPFRELGGGIDVLMHDPRGTLWFARVTQSL